MTSPVPTWLYIMANGDLVEFDRLEKRWREQGEPTTSDHFQRENGTQRAATKARTSAEHRTAVLHSIPVADPRELLSAGTRGPWVLDITGLGRPTTTNRERTSSMSAATMALVRKEKREWHWAVEMAAREANIPPLRQAFVVMQAYYPTNVVPDPDALAPLHKAAHDGLAAAGVLADDRREQLPFGYHPLPPYTDGGEARVTLTVYPLA